MPDHEGIELSAQPSVVKEMAKKFIGAVYEEVEGFTDTDCEKLEELVKLSRLEAFAAAITFVAGLRAGTIQRAGPTNPVSMSLEIVLEALTRFEPDVEKLRQDDKGRYFIEGHAVIGAEEDGDGE